MTSANLSPLPQSGFRYGDQQHARLLTQDDAIPGNSKDGFRFHYLIFAIIGTPLYLWLELSFGVRLLDNISTTTSADHTDAIEHWGRLISGCAVSLLFLTQWFGQCEKWDRPWWVRLSVAVVICAICVPVAWVAQSRVIDFYVKQGSTEIALALPLMGGVVAIGLYAMRRWLRTYGQRRKSNPLITMGVLALMALATGIAVRGTTLLTPRIISYFVPSEVLIERLGKERQEAATLALIKKGLQGGVYTLTYAQSRDLTRSVVESPEGKATMAMFPVLGSAMDPSRFVADRPRVLQEVMYIDWDGQYGTQSFNAFKDLVSELKGIFAGQYKVASEQFAVAKRNADPARRALAQRAWETNSRAMFEESLVRPGLTVEEFGMDPGVSKLMGKRLACFDCQFTLGMNRAEFTYELFLGTQMNNYRSVLEALEDPKHFESGHDGEAAARTYWVPIWALLFSMMGAFTHLFKLAFTVAEYANLRTFAKVHAADSPLSNDVVVNTRRILLAVMAAIVVFIYFFENRITGPASYRALHAQMWKQNPVVGGLAAHWTINAQGIIYPFTKKICPDWLAFSEDPFEHFPLSLFSSWVVNDE